MDIDQVTIVSNSGPDYSDADLINTSNSESDISIESEGIMDNSVVRSAGSDRDMGTLIDIYT